MTFVNKTGYPIYMIADDKEKIVIRVVYFNKLHRFMSIVWRRCKKKELLFF